jgi:hypothetical protein
MGRIGEIVEFRPVTVDGDEAVEITVDLGAGDVVTVVYAEPTGYFSRPLEGDLAIIAELDGAEEYALIGIVDVSNANALATGEVVFYSRGADGNVAAYVNLKNTGEIIVGQANASIQIGQTGNVTITNPNNQIVLNASGCAINGHLTVAAK